MDRGAADMDLAMDLTEFKKKLLRIYNEVNKEIYGCGVVELKINVSNDMIMFITRHNRVQALKVLENRYFALKQSVDYALFQEFKLRLREKMESQLSMTPKAMLRDYDPDYQIAVTVVFLE